MKTKLTTDAPKFVLKGFRTSPASAANAPNDASLRSNQINSGSARSTKKRGKSRIPETKKFTKLPQ